MKQSLDAVELLAEFGVGCEALHSMRAYPEADPHDPESGTIGTHLRVHAEML